MNMEKIIPATFILSILLFVIASTSAFLHFRVLACVLYVIMIAVVIIGFVLEIICIWRGSKHTIDDDY